MLSELKAGQAADLSSFPAGQRELSAAFLRDLLKNSEVIAQATRTGLTIRSADISGDVDLSGLTVPFDVSLISTRFSGDLRLPNSVFGRSLRLTNSTLQALILSNAEIGGDLILSNAIIEGYADLSHLDLKGNLDARDVQFLATPASADFSHLRSGKSASINGSRVAGSTSFAKARLSGGLEADDVHFSGPVTLQYAQIGESLTAERSVFDGSGTPNNLADMRVAGSILLSDTRFTDHVRFTATRTAGSLSAPRTEFKDAQSGVAFDDMRIGGSVFLNSSVFLGPVDFRFTDITGNLNLESSNFSNAVSRVEFYSTRLAGLFNLKRAKFFGPTSFVLLQVGGNVDARYANFASTSGVDLNSMRVGNNAHFSYNEFHGPVQFNYMTVVGHFNAHQTQFLHEAQLYYMKVGGSMDLSASEFSGPVDVRLTTAGGQLIGDDTTFKNSSHNVNLDGVSVNGICRFDRAKFAAPIDVSNSKLLEFHVDARETDRLKVIARRAVIERDITVVNDTTVSIDATQLRVNGAARFSVPSIESDSDLSGSSISTIDVKDVREIGKIGINGMTFGQMSMGAGPKSAERVIEFLNSSAYSPSAYANMENYVRAQGNLDLADDVYIAQRRREQNERKSEDSWMWSPIWLRDEFFDLTVGYGRKPERTTYLLVGVIIAGVLFFNKNSMVCSTKDVENVPKYSRLLYSVDLFMPVVQLGASETWQVRADRKFVWWYMQVHRLLGWLILPFIGAAWTGIIS